MKVQFIDLKRQQEEIKTALDESIQGVLAHGKYIMGPEVGELEAALADFAGTKHAVGCSSGTDALIMPLMAWNIGPGDAVFTPTFTFISTAEVVSLLGATPVFVDIDPDTFNMSVDSLKEAVEKVVKEGKLTPRVIIPVDLFGLPADYEKINALAAKYGMKVLEDAAQGFGGRYQGKRAGSLGSMGATSFFPAKPLGCYGDGGAIFTDSDEEFALLKSIRVHGQGSNKYDNVRIGLNGRLDTLQAAILKVKLDIFPKELEERQRVAGRYAEKIGDAVVIPKVPEGYYSAWAQYTVMAENRQKIQAALKEEGIPTAVYYIKPLHLQEAFADLGYKKGEFPVSEAAAAKVFSLPMHPYLKNEEVDFIAEKLVQHS